MSSPDENLHTGHSSRTMSGSLRAQVKKTHLRFRQTGAAKLMDLNDPEPSHVPNLASVCKTRTRQIKSGS